MHRALLPALLSGLVLCGLALAAPLQLRQGPWSVQWGDTSASAQGPAGRVSLYAPPAARACPQAVPAPRLRGALLALVGPYASVYTETRDDCGAHPSLEQVFTTTRLPGQEAISLTDLFPERALLVALLADPWVKGALAGARPQSLAALEEAYGDHRCTRLDADALSRFAFYDLQGSRVAVRLSLPEAAYSCRPGFIQLALWLPVPAALRADLTAAKRAGALMVSLRVKTDLLR